MTVDDRESLAALARHGRSADFRLGSIVESLATSDLFQKR